MNIHHLAVLAAIAEEGSFSAAALRLDTSQAATSRAIAALEDELGLPLLKRGRFGAMLTPVGQRVLHHAQQMLELREYIEYEVNLEKGLYAGRLRIASFRSAATHLLPPIMASFHERFPRVEVSLTELEPPGVEQALREGQVDLGLVPLPRSEEFNQWEVARDEYVVLLPASVGPLPTPPQLATVSQLQFCALQLCRMYQCGARPLATVGANLTGGLWGERRFHHCQHGGPRVGGGDFAPLSGVTNPRNGAGAIATPCP
jgi:DNA-binding transcriptional LysR family regulator